MKIFIGSSSEAADNDVLLKVAGILRDAGAEPVLWNAAPSIFRAGVTTIENLEEIVERENIKASVFIYSEDDKTWHRGNMQNVPRDNVVFEHGLFVGILGRKKAITVKVGDIKMPSDLHGLTCIDYGRNPENATLDIRQWVKGLLNCVPINDSGIQSDCGSREERKLTLEKKRLVECILIPPGSYYRIIDDEEIKINNSLSISKNLTTQAVYNSIMGSNPSCFEGDSLPVENISFHEAIIFCNKLSEKEGYDEVYTITENLIQWNKNAKGYRLPFEIEWEYALGYNIIEIRQNLGALAWYCNNSDNKTHDVGLKKGNSYGLFDLLGNVWEWCFDNYEEYPHQSIVLEKDTKLRVLRGGSFANFEKTFTKEKAFRKKQDESVQNRFTGFRIVFQNINLED